MSAKPWLAAKTAGEAYKAAFVAHSTGNRFVSDIQDSALLCVIEWHEAQRERVGEYWKVRTLMHDYDYTDEQIARDTAYGSEPRAKLIHVTCYRRKSKGDG